MDTLIKVGSFGMMFPEKQPYWILPMVVVSLSGSLPRPASELLSDTLSSWMKTRGSVNPLVFYVFYICIPYKNHLRT